MEIDVREPNISRILYQRTSFRIEEVDYYKRHGSLGIGWAP